MSSTIEATLTGPSSGAYQDKPELVTGYPADQYPHIRHAQPAEGVPVESQQAAVRSPLQQDGVYTMYELLNPSSQLLFDIVDSRGNLRFRCVAAY